MASVPGATSPQDAAGLIRRLYGAFTRGDLPAVFRLLAPGFVMKENAPAPLGGSYQGHDGFRRFLAVSAEMPGHVSFTTTSLTSDARHAFALNRLHRDVTGVDADVVEMFTVAGGLITRLDVLPVDWPTWLEFWA